ncbi:MULTISPECIES: stage V sporulation protein AB [unclassified Virgibacillus]|uniref:stage V sporulation protein AB n=1 Tax=unclassified Virgibacillus TaxID=2620237 RepID=UPI0024DEF5C2|nr:stage V sporulation protein AB [Virgibacillus sp. LDC-1]
MNTVLLIKLTEVIIGFASGIAVGSGFVAFLTVLGVIPRLIQLANNYHLVQLYGICAIAGALFGTYLSFTDIVSKQSIILLLLWGALHGVFNGMLAAALTEVLNVFPILTKRIGIQGYLLWLVMAVVFGKIIGSLFQWLILERL